MGTKRRYRVTKEIVVEVESSDSLDGLVQASVLARDLFEKHQGRLTVELVDLNTPLGPPG